MFSSHPWTNLNSEIPVSQMCRHWNELGNTFRIFDHAQKAISAVTASQWPKWLSSLSDGPKTAIPMPWQAVLSSHSAKSHAEESKNAWLQERERIFCPLGSVLKVYCKTIQTLTQEWRTHEDLALVKNKQWYHEGTRRQELLGAGVQLQPFPTHCVTCYFLPTHHRT